MFEVAEIDDADGVPFHALLRARAGWVGGSAKVGRSIAARARNYLLELDVFADELGRLPTDEEHAERWATTTVTIVRTRRELRSLFPGMQAIEVLETLWAAVEAAQAAGGRGRDLQLDAVRVRATDGAARA